MSPRAWIVGLAALACGGCASATAVRVRYPIAATTASNRAAAIVDAAKLLSYVVPPAGATLQSSGAGTGSHGHIFSGYLDSATAWKTWVVPGDLAAVFSFVQAHLPRGGTVFSTGSGGPTPSQLAMYRWPPMPAVVDPRMLEIDATTRSGGGTTLYADAQTVWWVTRPVGERVPTGVRTILVTESSTGERAALVSRVVTSPAKIRALVDLVDSFPLVQPVAINCPAFIESHTIAVSFRSASGDELARATASSQANESWPPDTAGWACIPTTFSVRGHPRPALAGNLIRPLERILHIHVRL